MEVETPCTASLKRTDALVAGETPVAPQPGEREVRVGGGLLTDPVEVAEQVLTKTITE